MKLFTTKQKGDIGEKFTERYLKKNGYKILERNYRQKCGEIDIIAQKGEYIIFTEVKTRAANFIARPYEAVDRRKPPQCILPKNSLTLISALMSAKYLPSQKAAK